LTGPNDVVSMNLMKCLLRITFCFLAVLTLNVLDPHASWAQTLSDTPTPASLPTGTQTPSLTITPTPPPISWTGEKFYTYDTQWGSKGTELNQLNDPEGICVGPDDNLYIADTLNNRILKWTDDGKPVTSFGSFGTVALWRNPPQFDHPLGVLVVPDGMIYVADGYNNRIVVLDHDGLVSTAWGKEGVKRRQFSQPRALARDHFGNIWVLDSLNSRVQNFSNAGKFNFVWGAFGTSDGALNLPLGMALNSIDQAIIADTGNFRIQVFNDREPVSNYAQMPVTSDSGSVSMEPTPDPTLTAAPVTMEGWFGEGPCQFKEPAGVVINQGGVIAVVDGVSARVEFFNHRFEFIGQWQDDEPDMNPASHPHFRGIACDSKNRLYLTDIQNDRIVRLKVIKDEVQVTPGAPTSTPTNTPIPTPTPEDTNPYGGVGFPIR